MSFLQVQQSLVTHRKTLRLARLLSLDRYAVVGRLVALWAWCLDNALDGALGDDIDADILADVMGFDASLGKPATLLDALLSAGFLDLDPSGDESDPYHPTLRIHDWHEHMGRLIEKREADAERQRRHRAQARVTADVAPDDTGGAEDVTQMSRGRHADVTHQSRVEKNRAEQSITTSEHGAPSERTHASDGVTMAADAALSPSLTPATGNPSSSSEAPKKTSKVTPLRAPRPTGARLPDPVWDACIAAMGAPPSNHVERGKWAKGIVGLKESLTAALPPGVTAITAEVAAEIGVRSRRYRARYGTGVPLNPMALAGNWTVLATDISPEEGRRHGRFESGSRFNGRGSATAGRSSGGRSDGRPAIGTPAYYAQAAAAAQGSHAHGGGAAGQGGGVAAVGEW